MPMALLTAFEPQPFHIAGLIAVAVFILALQFGRRVRAEAEIRDRMVAEIAGAATLDEASRQAGARLMARATAIFGGSGTAASSPLRRQLVLAGFFSEAAPAVFQALRFAAALGFPIAFMFLSMAFGLDLPGPLMPLALVALTVLGFILPPIALDMRARHLQQTYRHTFPDMMELLVVCVEAGQSVHAAFASVCQEMLRICPPLGFNLHLVNLELRAGASLYEALLGLQHRVGLDEVKALAVLLKQSEELGSSIANRFACSATKCAKSASVEPKSAPMNFRSR